MYATLDNPNNQLGSPVAIPASERHLNGSAGETSLVLRMWEGEDDARAAAVITPFGPWRTTTRGRTSATRRALPT